jgi:hypothetical protein
VTFEKDGFLVRDLGPEAVSELRDLAATLSIRIGAALPDAHSVMRGDIVTPQSQLRDMAVPSCRRIVKLEGEALRELLDDDVVSQKNPYLRIARPGAAGDNIGFHKDTWYGGDAREVSVWIPLVDVAEDAALRLRPGSHKEDLEMEPAPAQAERGSVAHSLGFLYAPKRLKRPVEMKPVPMKFGQMLVMSLALLHGQEENGAGYTRWSMDCRVVGANADIGARNGAYAPL